MAIGRDQGGPLSTARAGRFGTKKHAPGVQNPYGPSGYRAGRRAHARPLANRFFARSYRRRIRSRGLLLLLRCTSQLICSTCHAPHTPLQQVHTPAATLDPDTAAAVNQLAAEPTRPMATLPFILFDNMLRSKTQVVDDTIPTKTSLKAVHNEGCAFTTAFTHISYTQFQPTTSSKPRTNHRSSATHRQNEPSEHYIHAAGRGMPP